MAIDRTQLIERIKEIGGLTNDERSSLLELLRTTPKYGLVWENKPEDVEAQMQDELPVFTEVKERAIISDNPEAPNHILIEGDNLHALTALTYTHEGKIGVIYIDPPYNTGNKDFIYNDSYVDKEDGYRHSKWLSFMAKRLRIAKRLLSQTGFICISIDDNEQSQLKMLCDEIFGFQNFINIVSVKAKSSAGASGGGEDKKLKKNIEYLLIYTKDREAAELVFPLSKVPLFEYIQEKKDANITWSYTNVMYKTGNYQYYGSTKAGNGEDIEIYHVTDFEIKSVTEVARLEGISEEDVYNKYIDRIFTTENAQTSIRTRIKDATPDDDGLYIARYVPKSGRNKGQITDVGFIGNTRRLVSYLKNTCHIENGKVYKLEKIGTLWSDLSWSSISKEGGIPFPAGKKPIALIKRIISMHPDSDIYILDFFAGSGSTAHAVMALNSEDNGKRISIMCTSNEGEICETKTYPRCANVIHGYSNVPGLKANSLRYYRTKFVPRERTQKNMRQLVAAATDLLCIKNDLYTETEQLGGRKMRPSLARHFKDGDKEMLIIYDDQAIPYIAEMLKSIDVKTPILTYVFSPNNYPYTDEFYEVSDKVKLCALPAAIYDAYRKVLKKPKPRFLEAESGNAVAVEDYGSLGGLFETDNEEGGNA